jgi:hypothetical protein
VRILEGSSFGVDLAELSESIAAFESSPVFRDGLRFAGWSFEVRVDAC